LIERRDDTVRFLARLHEIHEGVHGRRSLVNASDRLGEKSCDEEGVVADVLAYFPFIEEGPAAKERIGFDQHLSDFLEPLRDRAPHLTGLIPTAGDERAQAEQEFLTGQAFPEPILPSTRTFSAR